MVGGGGNIDEQYWNNYVGQGKFIAGVAIGDAFTHLPTFYDLQISDITARVSFSVDYSYDDSQPLEQTPEPATFMMTAGGLLVLRLMRGGTGFGRGLRNAAPLDKASPSSS